MTPRILALVMGYIMYGEWVEAEGRSALNSPPHGCVSSLKQGWALRLWASYVAL